MSKTCVVQQECHTGMSTEKTMVQRKIKTIDHSASLWPFYPKSESSKLHSHGKQNTSFQPSVLLRSGSLDRIRQFPAYLCRRGSNSVLFWLYQSRSAFREVLSSAHGQLRGLLLTLCVYLAIGVIAAQLLVCLLVMSIALTTLPSGFIFLFACIASITVVGFKVIRHDKDALINHS